MLSTLIKTVPGLFVMSFSSKRKVPEKSVEWSAYFCKAHILNGKPYIRMPAIYRIDLRHRKIISLNRLQQWNQKISGEDPQLLFIDISYVGLSIVLLFGDMLLARKMVQSDKISARTA